MKVKEFAIIGCGRFGNSLATTLSDLGHEVIVIDKREEVINKIAPVVTYAAVADANDEEALRDLGISNVDTAIVAISSDFEASIMSTITCKNLGIDNVVAKAKNDTHALILKKVGADSVVIPERAMGEKLGHSLYSKNVVEFFNLSSEHSILEIRAPKKWIGKSIQQLNIRAKYGLNILGIIRTDGRLNGNPGPLDEILPGDNLIVLGDVEDLALLEGMDNE